MSVQRYDLYYYDLVSEKDGNWVLYSDYQKLEQQRDKLVEASKDYILDCSCDVMFGNSLDVLNKLIAECEEEK